MVAALALVAGLAAGTPAVSQTAGQIFVDAAPGNGLDFVHFNGMTGKHYFPEMTGQGGALLDYDNDGDLDAYLLQGSLLGPDETLDDALVAPRGPLPPSDRLFRNDLVRQGGGTEARFVDATAAAGLAATGYGMGVATGDIDNDGWVDLYVTNYGPNQLWRNNGDGTFRDVTAASGTGDPLWGTSATFFDLDGDGLLDLYVANYVVFDVAANPRCFAPSSRADYCGPSDFPPQPDRLYRNLGGGRFEDVTRAALIGYRPGPGLGVVAADFNGDGRTDVFVANDGALNQLWINRGDGTMVDDALIAGVAVNREGRAEASMGVDAGDFDGDGDDDLFMTHLMGETNTLYVNDGTGLFEDRTIESGLAAASLPFTSFGTSWIDYDNDGALDLLALNGAVRILEEQAAAGDVYPLRQPNQLFHNVGGSFVDVTAEAGEPFGLAEVSRGAAFGDVDNDGDVDVLQFNNNGPARLLLNREGSRSGWVGVRFGRRDGGAVSAGGRIRVRRAGAGELWRRSRTDGSYCSASDPRVTLGLGAAEGVAELTAVWTGGARQTARDLPGRRYLYLFPPRAGEGSAR